ncbi:MAG: rhodanese-like domain-containing protein [Desulfonatronovibrionaceae bacterium]
MQRIVIIGQGYQAFKAAGLAARLKPEAEVLWIADRKLPEYPDFLLGLLLRSGLSPDKWSRARAGLKVDFENMAKERSLTLQKVSKIRINTKQGEISFLSERGPVSYSFDQIICMAPTKTQRPPQSRDADYIWPDPSTLSLLTREWNTLVNPLVIGPDPALVQLFACSGRKCTWLPQGNFLDAQLQYFVVQRLETQGIQVLSRGSQEEPGLEKILASGDFTHVLRWGQKAMDVEQLKIWGLEPGLMIDEPYALRWDNVFVLCPPSSQHQGQLANDPESALEGTLKAVRAVLTGSSYCPARLRTGLWNLGDFTVARVEKLNPDAGSAELIPAAMHGFHSQDPQRPYALCLWADPESRQVERFECAGVHAADLAARAASFMACRACVLEMHQGGGLWPEHEINPFVRCAGILEKKMEKTILGITPDELQQSRENQADFFLLDVRSRPEFEACRLPGACNIPLKELKKRVMEIPRFTPIVIYSQCSGRAYSAAALLRGMGARQLYVLDGGIGLYTLSKDDSLADAAASQPEVCSSG